MFLKIGENIDIERIEDTNSCVAAVSPEILKEFTKFASTLRKIAPKAEDFLYFTAIMMHAAEASAINDDGTPKLRVNGSPVEVGWEEKNGSLKWVSNDPSIKAYRNSNLDIFPASELIKAHKKWVHKPLCIDHKSSSVDHVRGFIVDTYYDHKYRRVVALCALDKAGFPQLARQVQTGVSTAVSMGTAVGKAICYDCGKVARTEHDFCNHMKTKSSYGEINVDLNPLELSIVVNGADPKAHIKHVLAAAQTLNNYVENKEKELQKLAEDKFSISFNLNKMVDDDQTSSTNVNLQGSTLDELKEAVEKAFADFEKLNSSAKEVELMDEDSNNSSFSQSSGSDIPEEVSAGNETDNSLAPPHARFGHEDISSLKQELRQITASLETKLSNISHNLNQLSQQHQHEEIMSKELNKKGYFQGTEEPTPGEAKYPKDPMNEKLRLNGDKQMVGQMDTSPVDGMHPGPDSVNMSELERKKMLARADVEERALRRQAIIASAKQALNDKKAYFNNGEGPNNPNTPTPGKVKYPADKMNEDLRESGDKQMVGQKPFPGVGSVDGLHPSPASVKVPDELKRKEMLQRASFSGKFNKVAKDGRILGLGEQSWEISYGDQLVLTASVNELSGNQAEMYYDSIATKEFGQSLIKKVKTAGADKVKALFKQAQDMGASMPAPAPEAPAPAPMGSEAPAEDTNKSGDPKETAVELSGRVKDLSSDLDEAVKALTGEQAEMGEMPATASDLGTLQNLRKELNASLLKSCEDALAGLEDHDKELTDLVKLYDSGKVNDSNQEYISLLAEDAIGEAKKAVAEGFALMTGFVRYARGSQNIVKQAEMQAELNALASDDEEDKDDNKADDNSAEDNNNGDDLLALIADTNEDLDMLKEDVDMGDDMEMGGEHDMEDANDIVAKPEELKSLEVKPGTKIEVQASLDTKEGRAQLRAKLAGDALKYAPVLDQAHPKGGTTIPLDVKPEGDLAHFEDLKEKHEVFMDVATAPVKIRKEAESIHRLISEGKLEAGDLDALVAEGLDKDAVAYYKKYYAQAEGGSEFASELVKEHIKAQVDAEINTFKVKMARAYELAYEMVDRGLLYRDRSQISNQVDEIMSYNDTAFESLKKVVARHAPANVKTAGKVPQVGLYNEENVAQVDMFEQLSNALSKSTRRVF